MTVARLLIYLLKIAYMCQMAQCAYITCSKSCNRLNVMVIVICTGWPRMEVLCLMGTRWSYNTIIKADCQFSQLAQAHSVFWLSMLNSCAMVGIWTISAEISAYTSSFDSGVLQWLPSLEIWYAQPASLGKCTAKSCLWQQAKLMLRIYALAIASPVINLNPIHMGWWQLGWANL